MNFLGGYRNTMTLVLTGLDIEEKAAWATEELFDVLGGRAQFEDVDVRLLRFDQPDAPTNEQATAHLRITVKDPDPRKVGRRFSNATMELALGGYAGFHTTTPPTPESAFGVYWPTLVPAAEVTHTVVLPDGTAIPVPSAIPAAPAAPAPSVAPAPSDAPDPAAPVLPAVPVPPDSSDPVLHGSGPIPRIRLLRFCPQFRSRRIPPIRPLRSLPVAPFRVRFLRNFYNWSQRLTLPGRAWPATRRGGR